MRRYWREPASARTFRGAELPRLMTGVLMLAVLWMLFARARDPDTWRWFAAVDGKRPSAAVAAPADDQRTKSQREADAQALEPTGPTDEDPDQAEAARDEFQVLTDGTLKLAPEEQLAYDRIVAWVKNQPFGRLYERALKKGTGSEPTSVSAAKNSRSEVPVPLFHKNDLWYADLYGEPDKHRGELVALELDVRLVKNLGDARYGMPLYELWGVTEESRGRLYDAIVIDYPKDMPDSGFVREKVRFAGYFLKLQGYEPATAKLGQIPDKAPLLIGRLICETVATPRTDNTAEVLWGAVVLAVVGAAWGMWRIYERLRGKRTNLPASLLAASTDDTDSVDAWLQRSTRNAAERQRGSEPHDGSTLDRDDPPGHPDREAPRFPEDLD
jgi:hypothetical protein